MKPGRPVYWFCSAWRPRVARTLLWVTLALSSGLALQNTREEGHVRERQLCGVVVNVHNNAKFRAKTEEDNLGLTREYLLDPTSRKENPALYERIKKNLTVTKQRVEDAHRNVAATDPPPICDAYAHEGQRSN